MGHLIKMETLGCTLWLFYVIEVYSIQRSDAMKLVKNHCVSKKEELKTLINEVFGTAF